MEAYPDSQTSEVVRGPFRERDRERPPTSENQANGGVVVFALIIASPGYPGEVVLVFPS